MRLRIAMHTQKTKIQFGQPGGAGPTAGERSGAVNITVDLPDGSVMTLHDEYELRAFLRASTEASLRLAFDGSADEVREAEWEELEDEEPDQPPCQHPRVYASGPRTGLCTVCGELAEEPDPQVGRVVEMAQESKSQSDPSVELMEKSRGESRLRARREVREFAPIEVPTQNLVVMMHILRRPHGGISRRRIVALTGCEDREVSKALTWLKKHELIERVAGHWRWRPTVKAKAHNLVAA